MMKFVGFAVLLAIPLGLLSSAASASRPEVGQEAGIQPRGELSFSIPTQRADTGAVLQNRALKARLRVPELLSEPLLVADLAGLRPLARPVTLPRTRWQHRPNSTLWTRGALSALKAHGAPLVSMVPADISTWCPAYAQNNAQKRRAFWVGFMSALAKYESTYKASAVGGGGRWYGLLQILPGTARGYGCSARSGDALKSGAANLSCAIRIMAVTVPRDGVIHGPDGRGVAADWGPLRSTAKRAEMAGWLRRQAYCKSVGDTRPQPSPRARP